MAAPDLPVPDLFNLAAATPIVVYNCTVYQLSNQPARAGAGFLVFDDARYRFVRLDRLAEFERRFFQLYEREIEAFKIKFLQDTVDQRIQTAQDQLKDQVMVFLMRKLIPRLRELSLGKEEYQRRVKRKRDDFIDRVLSYAEKPKTSRGGLLAGEFDGVAILDGRVYPLLESRTTPPGDLCIHIGGKWFELGVPARTLNQTILGFKLRFENFLLNRALKESPARMQMIRMPERQMDFLLEDAFENPEALPGEGQRYLYRDPTWGVWQGPGGAYYAYIEVPEYVVEDADGSFYRFDPTRVGVRCDSPHPSDLISPGRAVVLTAYEHMFVSAVKFGQPICMVTGEEYFSDLSRKGIDGLLTFILDASHTLMAGHYAGTTHNPHHSIKSFTNRKISLEEAEKRRLPVYRYFR